MKSLQEWYREINGIYVDRNFYRSTESVFAHLVEVSRGLSVAATQRRKRQLNAEEFLPKSIAWWLALCGRAGVPDVEHMVWSKYPAACSYCQRQPHEGRYCKESDATKSKIDWKALKDLGDRNAGERPRTLAAWQGMFSNIYPRDDSTNHETNVNRLTEELGELSEAVRTLPVAPQYFVSEAPDVFGWLMGFANQFDFDRREELDRYGSRLSEAMEREYPGFCKLCEKRVCKCPPIPSATLGRIAKDAPLDLIRPGRLFSLQESIQLFKRAEQAIQVANQAIVPHAEELHKIHADTARILEILREQADWTPKMIVSLSAAVGGLKRLAEQGEVTQAAVDELVTTLKQLPSEKRQHAIGFLNNLASSATFQAILVALQGIS